MSQHGSAEPEVQAKDSRRVSRRRFLAISATTGAAIAAGPSNVAAAEAEVVESGTSRSGLDLSSDFVQDPYFAEAALTKVKHRAEWGLDDAALAQYENDGGAKRTSYPDPSTVTTELRARNSPIIHCLTMGTFRSIHLGA